MQRPEAGSQEISASTWEECMGEKSIHSANRKTKMDYWVSYVAYFYDIYFPESAEIILENHYPTDCGADPIQQSGDREKRCENSAEGSTISWNAKPKSSCNQNILCFL